MADPIYPLIDLLEFTSFASDIDLTSVSHVKRYARHIKVLDAGNGALAVSLTGSRGETRPLTVTSGEELVGEFTKIVATGTTVAKLRIGW